MGEGIFNNTCKREEGTKAVAQIVDADNVAAADIVMVTIGLQNRLYQNEGILSTMLPARAC